MPSNWRSIDGYFTNTDQMPACCSRIAAESNEPFIVCSVCGRSYERVRRLFSPDTGKEE